MFNGNFHGVIIAILTLIIAVVMAAREVRDTGIRFELTIQPMRPARADADREIEREQPEAGKPPVYEPKTMTVFEKAKS
jgi:hypothetical protein